MPRLVQWAPGLFLLVFAGLLVVPSVTVGAQKGDKAKVAEEEAEDEGAERVSGHPSNHFKNFTKIRKGSVIRKTPVEEPAVDLRGEYERRRDYQVIRHFERLAELDAILEIAKASNETGLADRAEAVRRIELERFRLVMQRLRQVIRSKTMTGMP